MSPTDSPADSAAGRSAPALLTVRGLQKSFGNNQVLTSVDLTVARGTVLALIGPSGSGKTTVLRCLNGLEIADGGTISVVGGDDARHAPVTIDFAAAHGKRAGVPKKALGTLRDRSARSAPAPGRARR